LHWRRCWNPVGNHRALQTRSSVTWAYIIDGCGRSIGRCSPVLCRRIRRHGELADIAGCTSVTVESDLLGGRRSWWLVLVINQWLTVSLKAAVKLRGRRLRINGYWRWSQSRVAFCVDQWTFWWSKGDQFVWHSASGRRIQSV
jgi:hypothetical protein